MGNVPNVLPRQGFHWINALPNPLAQTACTIRFASLLDDLNFTPGGHAALTPHVSRGYGYNAAYLIQRAKNNVRHQANLKVIVYKGRPPSDTPALEQQIGAPSVTPASDQIPLAGIPTLRKGSWILLANQAQTTTAANAVMTSIEPFADFYRVVGQSASAVTVSPPIRGHGSAANTPATAAVYTANAFVLENVIEVFDRGTLTPFALPAN